MATDEVDVCLCCFQIMGDEKDIFPVNFRYQVPASGITELILIASCCMPCAKDADDPKLFPAVEAMINARYIRIAHQEYSFTPKGW